MHVRGDSGFENIYAHVHDLKLDDDDFGNDAPHELHVIRAYQGLHLHSSSP